MNEPHPAIHAPVTSGSGVQVVHDALAQHLRGYRVRALPPVLGLFPALGALVQHPPAPVTHSIPELGPWVAHPDSTLVVTFHNFYTDAEYLRSVDAWRRRYYQHVLRHAIARSLRVARAVTAVSHYTAALVRRELNVGARLVVIRNGVDTDLFHPGPDRSGAPLRVLYAGNPTLRKGSSHLAALAEQLPPNVELCYTTGVRASALSTPATSARLLALPGRPHAEMPALYRECDLLFLPSEREGFGLVVAEAMACGLPIVASDCSAIPELVVHGRGGLLFEPGNRAQMLEQLLRLSRDAALRREMGLYNRARVLELFPLRRMLQEYRQLFASLGVAC